MQRITNLLVSITFTVFQVIAGALGPFALILPIALFSILVKAETYHLSQPGGGVTKFKAIMEAAKNPGTIIYKCSATKITEKATFKNIPATGSNDFIVAPTETEKAAVKGSK